MNILYIIKTGAKLFLRDPSSPLSFFFFSSSFLFFIQSNTEKTSKNLIYMHAIIFLYSILGSEGQAVLVWARVYRKG